MSCSSDVGAYDARTNGGHANARRRQLGPETLGQHERGGLRRGVHGEDLRGLVGGGRGDVDDVPTLAPLHHLPAEGAAAIDDAPEVDIQGSLPVVDRAVEEGPGDADAGVVD